jgi:hypothetical protein
MSFHPMAHVLGFTMVFRSLLLRLSDLWPNSIDHLNPSEPMGHDQWFFLSSALGKVGYIDEPLAAYVQHGRNVWGWRASTNQSRASIVSNKARLYSRRATFVEGRARVLEAAAQQLNGFWKARAEIATENYERLAACYSCRAKIYSSRPFTNRLHAFCRLLGKGAYTGNWGFGAEAFVRDICLGVPIGPRLRPGTESGAADWRG